MTINESFVDHIPQEITGYWKELTFNGLRLVCEDGEPSLHMYANVLAWTESAVEEMSKHGIDPGKQLKIQKIIATRIGDRLIETRFIYNTDYNIQNGYLCSISLMKGKNVVEENRIWKKDGIIQAKVRHFQILHSA